MAYDIATRALAVADGVQALIAAAWSPSAPDDCVRDYVTEETIKTLQQVQGRHLFVFPAGSKIVRPIARGAGSKTINLYEHRVAVRGLEAFHDAGRPSKAWIDTRVVFLGQKVHDVLICQDPSTYLLGALYTSPEELPEVSEWAQADMLLGAKLWWGQVDAAFYEIAQG